MINLLSIRCGVPFSSYLLDGLRAFLRGDGAISQVFRQAASGIIIRRADEGGAPRLNLRHQGRDVLLAEEDAQHYEATVGLRAKFYDVARTSDEVIFASVGNDILLSHPQSELWLPASCIANLLDAFSGNNVLNEEGLPDWLTISGGAGRLLLSDRRSGRWVLLGADHFAEFARRTADVQSRPPLPPPAGKSPTIWVKGVTLYLQSAFKLAATLETFAESGAFQTYEEETPHYCLGVGRASEGMQLVDSNLKTAITAREARKWAAILRDELERRNAREFARGGIRTVFALSGEKAGDEAGANALDTAGTWALQWGDEVLLMPEELQTIAAAVGAGKGGESTRLMYEQGGDYLVILDKATGNCVALSREEAAQLFDRE